MPSSHYIFCHFLKHSYDEVFLVVLVMLMYMHHYLCGYKNHSFQKFLYAATPKRQREHNKWLEVFYCWKCRHTGKKKSSTITTTQHSWTSHFRAQNGRDVITVVNWFLVECHWEWEFINTSFQSLETPGTLPQGLLCGVSQDIFLRVTAIFERENVNIILYIMIWNAFSTVFVKKNT